MTDILVATVPKNSKEELRVLLTEYNGRQLVNMRVFFDAGGGEMRPSKTGLAMRIEAIEPLLVALGRARDEAVDRGLLLRS